MIFSFLLKLYVSKYFRYGVIDLYGQAANVTIIDLSEWPHHRSLDGFGGNTINTVGHNNGHGGTSDQELVNYNRQLSGIVGSSTIAQQVNELGVCYGGMLDTTDCLRFHHLHGRNAKIGNGGFTASRPHALGEFNDSIVMSNRPLRDGEMFEIVIERTVERWSGAIEAGVTLIRPEDLEFPNTMTDIDYDTWMLSGSAVMQDGQTVRNGYCCDLDSLGAGSRLGMMRNAEDGSLHYTINGEDQGVAIENVPSNVYAVIDLYGQCAQVSIIPHPATIEPSMRHSITGGLSNAHFQGTDVQSYRHASSTIGSGMSTFLPGSGIPGSSTQLGPLAVQENNSLGSSQIMESSHISLQALIGGGPEIASMPHRLSPLDSKSVEIKNNGISCIRKNPQNCISALVFANNPFQDGINNVFEVQIDEISEKWSGSLKIGITTYQPNTSMNNPLQKPKNYNPLNRHKMRQNDAKSSTANFRALNGSTYWLEHCNVTHNGNIIKTNYSPSLDRLLVGDKLGVSVSSNGALSFLVNGEDCGIAAILGSNKSPLNKHKTGNSTAMNLVADPESVQRWTPVLELYGSTLAVTAISSFPHNHNMANTKFTGGSTSSIQRYATAGAAISPGGVSNHSLPAAPNSNPGITCLSSRVFGGNLNNDVQHMQDSLEVVMEQNENDTGLGYRDRYNRQGSQECLRHRRTTSQSKDPMSTPLMFHENHGRNVALKEKIDGIPEDANAIETSEIDSKSIAVRTDSYNQGIVLTNRPLNPGELFQVMVDKMNPRWSSTLSIGVLGIRNECSTSSNDDGTNGLGNLHLPITAIGLKKYSRIVSGDGGYYEHGKRLASSTSEESQEDADKNRFQAPPNLEKLLTSPGQTVGVMMDFEEQLHLFIDGEDHGIVGPSSSAEQSNGPSLLPSKRKNISYYGVIDIYGQCEQVTIIHHSPMEKGVDKKCGLAQDKKCAPGEKMKSCQHGHVVNEPAARYTTFAPTIVNTHLYLQRMFSTVPGKCAYLNLCRKFWVTMALPEPYFLHNIRMDGRRLYKDTLPIQSICYCPSCYQSSSAIASDVQNLTPNSESRYAYAKSGDPPKDYALPLGWVSFPMKQINSRGNQRKKRGSGGNDTDSNQRQTNQRENNLTVSDSNNPETNECGGNWHVAYHGSKAAFIRKILDKGELTPICELGLVDGGMHSRKPKASKEDDSDASPLLFSPTLRYVGESDILCPSVKFQDKRLLKDFRALQSNIGSNFLKAKVAFQLEVHPGSYKVGPPSSKMQEEDPSPPLTPPDIHFKLDETEWLTKERGNTVITALLIQLQLINIVDVND